MALIISSMALGSILTAVYCDVRFRRRQSTAVLAIRTLREGLDMHHIGKHHAGLGAELDALFEVLDK